ncbi:PilN domain-containing protein [Budvicia diplopodorum]|uniref:PilN domain-containing protein n=1 Tax=Budvicia diplopodorum TaxID=1119056 RepID=UPI00135A42E3|nr:PilN domain-containing protein [Budvicia diplopodorum]
MLQVNFLPWRRVKQRKQMRQFILLVLCYQASIAVALGAVYSSVHVHQNLLSGTLADLAASNRLMVQKVVQVKQYQKDLAELSARQEEIQNIKQSVANLEQLFAYFEQILTPDVGFKRIDLTHARLSVEGQGRGYSSIVDFYRKADAAPLIHDVQLGKVTVSATDSSQFLFSLTAELFEILP